MKIVSMREAENRLAQLIAKGEPFAIEVSGRLVASVEMIDAPASTPATRLGFMKGYITVPDDFDRMGAADTATNTARHYVDRLSPKW